LRVVPRPGSLAVAANAAFWMASFTVASTTISVVSPPTVHTTATIRSLGFAANPDYGITSQIAVECPIT
jgi:hypothetical protein